jgi:hypothetical protein
MMKIMANDRNDIMNDFIFYQICRLAMAEDEEGMNQLIAHGHRIDVRRGLDTPVMFLAKLGHHIGVNFLINQFHADHMQAVCGYAHHEFINHIVAGDNTVHFYSQILTKDMLMSACLIGTACCLQFSGISYEEVVPAMLDPHCMTHDLQQCALDLVDRVVRGNIDTYDGKQEKKLHDNYDDDTEKFIAAGLCYSGMDKEMNWLLLHGRNSQYQLMRGKIIGYSSAGCIDKIDMSAVNDNEIRQMFYMYCIRLGLTDKLNAGLNNETDNQLVVKAYIDSIRVKKSDKFIMNLLSAINDNELREDAATCIPENYKIDIDKYLREAKIINKIMQEYQISFTSARALRQKNVRLWLHQGKQITQERAADEEGVKLPALPKEIYQLITAEFLNIPTEKVSELSKAVNGKLYANMAGIHAQKSVKSFFKNHEQFKADLDNEEKRWKMRTI